MRNSYENVYEELLPSPNIKYKFLIMALMTKMSSNDFLIHNISIILQVI